MKKVIAVFDSTRAAINAERLCTRCNINCQVIPVPRDITADCGIALEISGDDENVLDNILKKENIRAVFHSRN